MTAGATRGIVRSRRRRNPRTKESSIPGIHVIGDATTMQQGAITAAADGLLAAVAMNHGIVTTRMARAAAVPPAR